MSELFNFRDDRGKETTAMVSVRTDTKTKAPCENCGKETHLSVFSVDSVKRDGRVIADTVERDRLAKLVTKVYLPSKAFCPSNRDCSRRRLTLQTEVALSLDLAL